MFEAKTYSERRRSLVNALARRGVKQGLVILIGNDDSPMNYGANVYAFRQDSSFLYFMGHDIPGLAASIDLGSGRSVLYADDVSMDDIIWTGALPSAAELGEACLADAVRPRARLEDDARQAARGQSPLLCLPPYRADTREQLARLFSCATESVCHKISTALIGAVVELREIKSKAEVAELDKAVGVSTAMHKAALSSLRAGMSEREAAALVTSIALAGGGGLSFPVIATTRGAVLHNLPGSHPLKEGGLFLLDAGATAPSGYAGDLTTTFPIGRRFDARQRELYELVLSMMRAASPLIAPGRRFKDIHLAAARAAIEGLKAMGLLKGDTDEALAAGAHALFFPHGLGHMIGLDVHDMEALGEDHVGYDKEPRSSQFGLAALRLAKPLAAGMVHSVEPGIYFIPQLIQMWRAEKRLSQHINYAALEPYLDFGGIRNEEDWLVTETGGRRLGPDFDKSAEAIESYRLH